jgi:hypothetical protein
MRNEMMAALAFDFGALLKDIPRGAWVAISSDQTHVVAFGAEMREVLEEAREKGEQDPIILRVPEAQSTLMM